uniref:Glycosyltransferase n=1 Tax=Ornithogalum saundersiae TaxID=484171 RepID=A0A8K1ZDZ5_9ASPA|nr:glycosyltransferase [Ornithogalum saundersiae]
MKQLIISNGFKAHKPHFVIVPLLAQGHTIPAVDMARLLAARGALVSFITTPVNAARIRPVIDQTEAEGLSIRFVELNFPWAEMGLPEGCENVDLVPSKELFKPFFSAISLLREPLELYLRKAEPSPTCIISDYCNFFTAEVAQDLSLPRVIFHGPSCFFILCAYNVCKYDAYEGVDEFEPVVVPNLPQKIETTKAQSPGWFAGGPDWADLRDKALEAEASADGIVINTFYELEPEIIEYYKKTIGKPVWPIGPLSLCNRDLTSKATRGKKSSIDEHQVLSWLDSMEPKSVLYANFGSLVRTKASQLIEIGCGLEASNLPFIWVIKEVDRCPELDEWMSEGFEERTKGRGLTITGWAPQIVILSHPSVGGFMTHCGWNSTLESICAGVPMITWPHFADQFLNEKLIVEVLKIGISVGIKVPYYYIKEGEVPAKREEVERAVASLMDKGEEGERRRERAAVLAEKAQKAMEEGGASHENLTLMIEHVMRSE